jgi:peptidoglycan/xylan/chitin deacetylase (PgdA/CDA1 family)
VDNKGIEGQIDIAKKKGFDIITENQLKNFYYNGANLKHKNLLITIDDGFADAYKTVKSVLNKRNIIPVMFIYPGSTGTSSYLNWNQVKDLSKSGANFGCHSFSHFNNLNFLKINDPDKLGKKLEKELIESSKIIEDSTGSKVISYAHPYGIFDPTIEKVTDIRYKLVYTTAKGPNGNETNPHRLNRYVIKRNTKPGEIEDYLDYEALPVASTYPDNGGFVGKEELIIFYFRTQKEMENYHGFKFMIDGDNKEIDVNIGKRIVWFDCKKIKRKVYDLSLKCYDSQNKKYIYSILINSEK